MHPFREGNGRSTRLFLQCYAANYEQVLDYPKSNEQMIQSENDADEDWLASLITLTDLPGKRAAYRLLYQREHSNRQKRR
jgi:cell filamentation protein